MTQHQGACSKGGSGAGGSPSGTAAVSKHETKYVTRYKGACSRGGSGRVPPRHGCCVQARDRYSKQLVLEGGGGWGGFPPGTAAVSKHEKGTVTKQITGALQFMVAFALRGGGQHLREYISLRCALGGGRSVPEPARL